MQTIKIIYTLPNIIVLELINTLEKEVKPFLSPDVSNYAKDRMRVWLNIEPSLTRDVTLKKSNLINKNLETAIRNLTNIAEFKWDYCLITNSGKDAIGIEPHRDATFAAYKAYGLTLKPCTFTYWEQRKDFDKGMSKEIEPTKPTHALKLQAGDFIQFNCKNRHSAEVPPYRWGLNFWTKK